MPYCPIGASAAVQYVDVADRYRPVNAPSFCLPVPSPPLNQIWLPFSPSALDRKLHAVRFSTETPSASNTSTPLRPSASPDGPTGPNVWAPGDGSHAGPEPAVPSTTTPPPSMPPR